MIKNKPVIKWAGGKTQLLPAIKNKIPKQYNTYFEPFFGGGALFFSIKPKKSVINDFNCELINLYNMVKEYPYELINELDKHQFNHSESYYLKIREDFNQRINNPALLGIIDAGELIYLNKMGFNGLYRVNSNGLYNVPSGHKRKCIIYDKENILEASKLLQTANILCADFEEACKSVTKGDFIFFDSPYYNTFDTYQKGGFSDGDHQRLALLFKELTRKGAYCLLTNSNTNFIKDLYREYNIDIINVKRMINCDGSKRTGEEVIITNY